MCPASLAGPSERAAAGRPTLRTPGRRAALPPGRDRNLVEHPTPAAASRKAPRAARPITASRPMSPEFARASRRRGAADAPRRRVDRHRRRATTDPWICVDLPCKVLCSARDRRDRHAVRAARDAPARNPELPVLPSGGTSSGDVGGRSGPADDYETRYGTDPVTAGEVIRTRTTLNESAGRVGQPPDAQRCRAGAGCPCRARRLASDRDRLATFGGYRDPETLEPRQRPVPALRAGRRAGAGRTTPGGPGGGPIPLRHPRSRATSSRGSGKAAAGIGGCGDSPARSGRARPLRLRAPAPGSCCARANRSPPVAARDRRLSRAR